MQRGNPRSYWRNITVAAILAAWTFLLGCDQSGDRADRSGAGGLTGSSQLPAGENIPIVRVLLLKGQKISVSPRLAPAGLFLRQDQRSLLTLPAGKKYTLARAAGKWQLRNGQGVEQLPQTITTVADLEIRPNRGGLLTVGRGKPRTYRGTVGCLARGDNQLAVVNTVDVESYLTGVVGAEMPAYWHKAALRAQSIACRTYALYQTQRNTNAAWDLLSDQFSQVYAGLKAETPRVREAVAQTRGVVLTYGAPGSEKIFPSYYSSTCGGHTEDAGEIFGDSLTPLTGRPCAYCRAIAPAKYYRWPEVAIAKRDLSDRLRANCAAAATLGNIVSLQVAQRADYGRLRKITLTDGSGKRVTIAADQLRLTLNSKQTPLLSNWYTLIDGGNTWRFTDGHGWGHGVGMCQCGGQGMAEQGHDAVAILQYYYPQARLIRAY